MKRLHNILIAAGSDELADEFVKLFVETGRASTLRSGRFTVSLSGGSTPKALYARLALTPFDWSNAYFFFGDERCVPPDSAESNYRMARESLLEPLGIGEPHIFRWSTELGDPHIIADDYELRLRTFFSGIPRFDLCLLGLGADGHTASLFPHTAALNDVSSIAVPNFVPQFGGYRLTLTAGAINNSADVLFVAAGAEKATALAAVVNGPYQPENYPAQLIKPLDGRLRWLVDAEAAALLQA